jgi:germination protein M
VRRVPLLAVLALLAAGCGGGTSGAPPPETTAKAVTATRAVPAKPLELRVYLLRKGVVAPVARSVPRTEAVASAALEQLLAGPTAAERDAGFATDVPAGAELRSLTIAGGTATVDFSKPFADGSAAQVVYTLTQFPTVSRVRFRLDGADLPALDHPVGRGDYEDLTPPLLVESPLPGETVASPLRIAGTANAYEATFQAELLDASGAVLVQKMVMATSGSGQRGTFEETLPYTGEGAGRLVVWEDSAADGSRIHQVEIPLELRP